MAEESLWKGKNLSKPDKDRQIQGGEIPIAIDAANRVTLLASALNKLISSQGKRVETSPVNIAKDNILLKVDKMRKERAKHTDIAQETKSMIKRSVITLQTQVQ